MDLSIGDAAKPVLNLASLDINDLTGELIGLLAKCFCMAPTILNSWFMPVVEFSLPGLPTSNATPRNRLVDQRSHGNRLVNLLRDSVVKDRI